MTSPITNEQITAALNAWDNTPMDGDVRGAMRAALAAVQVTAPEWEFLKTIETAHKADRERWNSEGWAQAIEAAAKRHAEIAPWDHDTTAAIRALRPPASAEAKPAAKAESENDLWPPSSEEVEAEAQRLRNNGDEMPYAAYWALLWVLGYQIELPSKVFVENKPSPLSASAPAEAPMNEWTRIGDSLYRGAKQVAVFLERKEVELLVEALAWLSASAPAGAPSEELIAQTLAYQAAQRGSFPWGKLSVEQQNLRREDARAVLALFQKRNQPRAAGAPSEVLLTGIHPSYQR